MLNNPWDSGSPTYRLLVVLGLIFTGVGILLSLLAMATGSTVLSWVAVPLIGIGLIAYIVSWFFRRPAGSAGASGRR